MNAIFKHRADAGKLLAGRLKSMHITNGVVLAIPRGGVPVGIEIARVLDLPLDIFLSKKIGHPNNPEYAIGSVTLEEVVLNGRATPIDPVYIKRQTEKIREHLRTQYNQFMCERQPQTLRGKTVILVDDGVATGNTLLGAIAAIRFLQPAAIIVAIPVAPPRTAQKLREVADDLICLLTPDDFYGVGQFYEDFTQVEDEDVLALLAEGIGQQAKM